MKKLQKIALSAFVVLLAVSFTSCTKDLKDRMDKVEKDVAQLITDVNELKKTLGELSAKVEKSVADILAAEADIERLEGLIGTGGGGGITEAELTAAINAAKAELQREIDAVQKEITVKDVTIDPATGYATMKYKDGDVWKTITYRPSTESSKVEVTMTDNTVTITVDGNDYTFPKASATAAGITGIEFIPTFINGSNEINFFEQGHINEIEVSTVVATHTKAEFNVNELNFRVNPSSFNKDGATWKIVNRVALTRANGDSYTLYDAPTYAPYGDGAYTFKFRVNSWVEPGYNATTNDANKNIVALEAVGDKVTSNYVAVDTLQYYAEILDKTMVLPATLKNSDKRYEVDSLIAVTDTLTPRHSFAFNATGVDKLNMHNLVRDIAYEGKEIDAVALFPTLNGEGAKSLIDHKFDAPKWKFTNVPYQVRNVGGGIVDVTDQSVFMKIESNGDLTPLMGSAAIGRTPVVCAELLGQGGKVIARTYIKFQITRNSTAVTHTVDGGTYDYKDLFKAVTLQTGLNQLPYGNNSTKIGIPWLEMNEIYEKLGVSHTEFATIYRTNAETTAPYAPVYVNAEEKARITYDNNANPSNTETSVFTHRVTPYALFGENLVTYTFLPFSNERPILQITFKYNIIKPALVKQIAAEYDLENNNKIAVVKGGLFGGLTFKMQAYLGQMFRYEPYAGTTVAPIFDELSATDPQGGIIHGAKHQFRFTSSSDTLKTANINERVNDIDGSAPVNSFWNGTVAFPEPLPGAYPEGNLVMIKPVTNDFKNGFIISLQQLINEPERDFKVSFYTNYVNGQSDIFDFTVRFMNPLQVVAVPEVGDNFTFLDKAGDYDWINVFTRHDVLFDGKKIYSAGAIQSGNYPSYITPAADETREYSITKHYGLQYPIYRSQFTAGPPVVVTGVVDGTGADGLGDITVPYFAYKAAGTGVAKKKKVPTATLR